MQEAYSSSKNSIKAVISLILGIVAFASLFIPSIGGFIGIVCAIVGLILGVMAKREGAGGMATAGVVLSAIGLVVAILALIFGTVVVGWLGWSLF